MQYDFEELTKKIDNTRMSIDFSNPRPVGDRFSGKRSGGKVVTDFRTKHTRIGIPHIKIIFLIEPRKRSASDKVDYGTREPIQIPLVVNPHITNPKRQISMG